MVTGADPALHARVRALLDAGVAIVVLDVRAITDPCPRTVDALLRLALTARRCGGGRVQLMKPRCGCATCWLAAGSPVSSGSRSSRLRIEPGGQAERGEQRGVEKVVMPGDPVAGQLDDLQRPRHVATVAVRMVRTERGAPVGRGGSQRC